MFYLDQETRKRYRSDPFTYGDVNYTYRCQPQHVYEPGLVQVIVEPAQTQRSIPSRRLAMTTAVGPTASGLADVQKNYCEQQVQAAQQNLKSTDYLFARAAENTTRR